MSSASSVKLMTAEEFFALPDDGVERWLIRGELREKRDTDMTRRSKSHSIAEGRITGILSTGSIANRYPAAKLSAEKPDSISGNLPRRLRLG
ncbi:MAG TPA: hypothetical protein VG122_10210 [Gemmata sp.]|jgi:hypothetical protein|nr:hypothetical protein [Gemmata sp.]